MGAIKGLEIMSVGVVTDSGGHVLTITEQSLDELAQSFASSARPAKLRLGHTSDAYNRLIAMALGVPDLVLTGEVDIKTEQASGQAKLGTMTNMYREGTKLRVDFDGVPDALTEIVSQGLFDDVSIEADMLQKDGVVVGGDVIGVALLGYDNPAVKDLAPISDALVLNYKASTGTISTSYTQATIDEVDEKLGVKGFLSAVLSRFNQPASKPEIISEEEIMEDSWSQFLKEMGFEESASVTEVIGKLKAVPEPSPELEPEPEPEPEVVDQNENPAFAALRDQVAKLLDKNAELEFERMVASYTEQAREWKNIPGAPEEMGRQLAEIARTINSEAADQLAKHYKTSNESVARASATSSLGTTVTANTADPTDPFIERVRAYATERNLSESDALKLYSRENPRAFNEYWNRNRVRG